MTRTTAAFVASLAAAAALPLLSLVGTHGALADPLSELPVKLWCWERFPAYGLIGGVIPDVGYPNPGALNNPDLAGTLLSAVGRPLLGRLGAYDLVVYAQLLANLAATAALAWELTRHRGAALFAAVVFGLTPLTLVYCVSGAVTDMLAQWPYALALRAGIRALGRPGWRDGLACGLWLGVGAWTCIYNFVVFSILAIPLAVALPAWIRSGAGTTPTGGRVPGQLGRAIAGAALGGAVLLAPLATTLRAVTADPTSAVSVAEIEVTRHHPPYTFLEPGGRDRYTAYLADYVAVGKPALIVRDNGSRYYRAFSPGLVALALAALGLATRRRRVGSWLGLGAFCAIASLGPFLPVTAAWSSPTAVNVVWLGLHHAWPGADRILEPFRYALPAVLALAMAAALTVADLARRYGAWVAPVATVAWLVELAVLSPVPAPLPTTTLPLAPGWDHLDDVLPPGPILALPYFEGGADIFDRSHFLAQLVHGRPIPDEVAGRVPRYLVENPFVASVLLRENRDGRLHVDLADKEGIAGGPALLARDGFVGVVVDVDRYPADTWRSVRRRLDRLGDPERVGSLLVYRLPAAGPE